MPRKNIKLTESDLQAFLKLGANLINLLPKDAALISKIRTWAADELARREASGKAGGRPKNSAKKSDFVRYEEFDPGA